MKQVLRVVADRPKPQEVVCSPSRFVWMERGRNWRRITGAPICPAIRIVYLDLFIQDLGNSSCNFVVADDYIPNSNPIS